MIILHYTLGLAPQRSGGLTKYANDLIKEQQKEHLVYLLYPSGWNFWSRNIRFGESVQPQDVNTIKLHNTLPIPLLFGVKTPCDFINSRVISQEELESLYNRVKPDVFHVHTLMGLPKELLVFFKQKGVKLIYTSHDYFGICSKVNLINQDGELCSGPSAEKCEKCNETSKPTIFLRIRNSELALNLKNNKLLRRILR